LSIGRYFRFMLADHYQVETAADFLSFEFVSVGPRGRVIKAVRYTSIGFNQFYNLGFGDKDPVSGYLSDTTVINNGDSQKVLATVASTLYTFTKRYPQATVVAAGSTEARTRLYRIGIASNLAAIEADFVVLGLLADEWEPFRRDVAYSAFLAYRKL